MTKCAQAEEKAEKTVLQLKENSQYVRQLMAKVSVRFGIEDLTDQIKLREQRIIEIEDMRVKIMQMIKGNSVPASTILISLKELQQEADAVLTEVNQLKAPAGQRLQRRGPGEEAAAEAAADHE